MLPPTWVSFCRFPRNCSTRNLGQVQSTAGLVPPTLKQLQHGAAALQTLRQELLFIFFKSGDCNCNIFCIPYPDFPALLKHCAPSPHLEEQKVKDGARQNSTNLNQNKKPSPMHCSGWPRGCPPTLQDKPHVQSGHPGCFPMLLTHLAHGNPCVRRFGPVPAINKVLAQSVRLTQIQGIKWCLIKVHRVSLPEISPLSSFHGSS